MLTHKNICTSVASFSRYLKKESGLDMSEIQSHMSYLPLSHAFEQSFQILMLAHGSRIGFHSGDVRLLAEDWKYLQPTIVCGVPRVYEKTIEKIRKSMAGKWYLGLNSWLGRAERQGKRRIRYGHSWGMNDTWYNKTIWAMIRRSAGWGSVKVLVSGASPLPAEMSEFLEILVGNPVLEGYGLTETFALGTHTVKDSNTKLNVGIPFDNIEIRLKSVPDQGYYVTDKIDINEKLVSAPRGEIQFRGPSVFKGYFKSSFMASEGLSGSDNEYKWLNTGDIGRMNPNRTLSIIGRTKELFKTRHGEYIAPRKIEGKYAQAYAVNQVWLYGNSYKNNVMAVVVPNHSWAIQVLKKAGIWKSSIKVGPSKEFAEAFSEAAGSDEAKDALKKPLLESMRRHEDGLNKRECVRDIFIETNIDELFQGFNVSNRLLTPTFKLRPTALLDHYRKDLQALYAANGEEPRESENW